MTGPSTAGATPPALCPPPQSLRPQPGTLRYGTLSVHGRADLGAVARTALEDLLNALPRPPAEASPTVPLRLGLDPEVEGDEAYRLRILSNGVTLTAATQLGIAHGLRTLLQWILENGSALPCVEIDDWPDFVVRGAMIDISRGKVPHLTTLRQLIDQLARHKINHLQLYMEHTFAYRGHEEVWRDWSALTAEELRGLDDYCQQRGIELTPNQNSFGHFHRWLIHDRYRPFAECPEGIAHPFAPVPEPFSLCPIDPRSTALLEDLYDQLLPNLRSRLFNVGLDETFDLGKGRSAAACELHGRQAVYLDFLEQIESLVSDRDHRMLFWADIVLAEPDSLSRLSAQALPLLWGYAANHPFPEQCAALAQTGREFWVCPGTSSWNSFAGRFENAIANIASAVVAGRQHGATGILITDWGDNGHLQVPDASLPGFLCAAAMSWNAKSAELPDQQLPVAAWLARLYRSEGVAAAIAAEWSHLLIELGRVTEYAGPQRANSSALFDLLVFAHLSPEARGIRVTDPELAEVEARLLKLRKRITQAPSASPGTVDRELLWTADILALASVLGRARLAVPNGEISSLARTQRTDLASRLRTLVAERRDLWALRNRPGGLDYSMGYLERVIDLLDPPA